MRNLLVTAGVWAAAFIYLCGLLLKPVRPYDFFSPLWLLITLAIQLALLVMSAAALKRAKNKWAPALCLILPLGTTIYFFTFGISQLEALGRRMETARQIEKTHLYEAVLKREKVSPGALAQSGYQYRLYEGPPQRVAFIQPDAMIFSGTVIIYDPADKVMQEYQLEKYSEIGGRISSIKHLRGHWYVCTFGD